MPDLLQDFPPWISSEIYWAAREEFLIAFWDDQEMFNETLICKGMIDRVYPMLRAALVAKSSWDAQRFLVDAKRAIEEFSTSIIPDDYLRQARDEYLDNAETDRKWNGKEAA